MEDTKQVFDSLLVEIGKIVKGESSKDEKLLAVCTLLKNDVPHYDWVGIYLVAQLRKRELVLGPFAGEPTEHIEIPFGRGICGQAAEREETFVVQDISKETNYLSCSSMVRSEIVVPIFKKGEVVGELDIDSHSLSPFTEEDGEFLEDVCQMISDIL